MQNGTAARDPPAARERSGGGLPGSSSGGGGGGGTNGTGGSGGGGGGGKETEQQGSAEHEALAAKLNELGGLVARFGVALPQVPQRSLRSLCCNISQHMTTTLQLNTHTSHGAPPCQSG
jgi:hypothetical protein